MCLEICNTDYEILLWGFIILLNNKARKKKHKSKQFYTRCKSLVLSTLTSTWNMCFKYETCVSLPRWAIDLISQFLLLFKQCKAQSSSWMILKTWQQTGCGEGAFLRHHNPEVSITFRKAISLQYQVNLRMGQKSVEMFGLGTPHSLFPLQEVSPTIPQLAGNLHSLLKPQI